MEGKRLGHYEILGLLGKGGMGEVYRARDTRLGREVAIKVLPEAIAADPAVRSRFEREATTISSLNHPHICVLHDVGEADGIRFLVMECVEGMTLDQRLREKPLSLDEVFRYGAQIADALDQAHRAGVIHRDLKPGNVMITRSGAKLMDFGLARATTAAATDDLTVAASPTVAHPLTQEGAIVGTFQYMSPEQLEGKEADHRSDLWALGCVLYEMSTGTRAFSGTTQASLIGSIMHQEPEPVSQRIDLAPPEFERLVNACLVKDPDERLQSAHDVKLQLTWLRDGPPSSSMAAAVRPLAEPRTRRGSTIRIAALAVLAALLGAAAMLPFVREGTPESSDRFNDRPARYVLGDWPMRPQATPVISPDGRSVVFTVREGMISQLYRRDFDELAGHPIPGTEGGHAPFFSPDGRWLGFVTDDAVRKIPFDGGISQIIAPVANINSGAWGEDGTIWFTPHSGGDDGETLVYRTNANGGPIDSVGKLDREGGAETAWIPEILPGGRTILLSTLGTRGEILAVSEDGTTKPVMDGAFLGRYVSTGHLVYRDNDSQATAVVPFDPDELEVTGGSIMITEQTDPSFCFDVSDHGVLVYVPAPSERASSSLIWVDPDGKREIAIDSRGSWIQPRISPDGRRVLVRKTGAECELWVLDRDRNSFSRVVQEGDAHDALWAPDGRHILYDQASTGEIVTLEISGSRVSSVVASGSRRGSPGSWSEGANLFAYTVVSAGGKQDIWIRAMDDPGADGAAFLESPYAETEPTLAPDGKWIAFTSTETGGPEIYVRAVPDNGSAWQVSAGGGSSPLWARDGSKLYYIAPGSNDLMVVDVDTADGLSFGVPQVQIQNFSSSSQTRDFDVADDGSFIVIGSPDGRLLPEIRVLTNWESLLNELAGDAR